MSDIEFDRDAVGINAKKDWVDANEFARIGSFLGSLEPDSVVANLPEGDNEGTTALRGSLREFKRVMRCVILEFSDACGILGSDQEAIISNWDATEYQSTTDFRELVAKIEGEK